MKQLFIAVLMSTLVACGGGGSGGGGKDPVVEPVVDCSATADGSEGGVFTVWIGSANGAWVVDADTDFARFFADTGELVYNGFVYDFTIIPGSIGGQIYEFGVPIDAVVAYVISNEGCVIMAVVAPSSGFYYDISEPEPGFISIELSDRFPIYATDQQITDNLRGAQSRGIDGSEGATGQNRAERSGSFTLQGRPVE